MENERVNEKEKAILVGIYGPQLERDLASEHLEELALLTITAGGEPVTRVLQQRFAPNVATYVGKGKLEEIAQIAESEKADLLIFDDDLSPSQAKNINRITKLKVLDRSGLILDIFAARAKTNAAKLQVELAQLEYLLPRLSRYWTHLERQSGGIGSKGPGETQLETDRRLITKRVAWLKEKLEKLDRQRATQRSGRVDRLRISLVGYTNAGKSSLMNSLTGAGVYAEDKLFATLDATVRQFKISTFTYLLSDTVGFIRKLPHGLIESFKSTLDEINESDLLLHVVDASAAALQENIDVVGATLEEIGAGDKPTLLVFNKIDRIPDAETMNDLMVRFPGAVCISALRNIGLDDLKVSITAKMEHLWTRQEAVVPFERYDVVSWLRASADISREWIEQDGYHFQYRIGTGEEEKFRRLLEMNPSNLQKTPNEAEP